MKTLLVTAPMPAGYFEGAIRAIDPQIDLIEHRPPIEQIGVCYSTRLVVRDSTPAKPSAA